MTGAQGGGFRNGWQRPGASATVYGLGWGWIFVAPRGRTSLEDSSAVTGAEPCSTSSPSAWSPREPALGPPPAPSVQNPAVGQGPT